VTEPPSHSIRVARWRVPLGFVFAAFALWLAQPTASTLVRGAAVATAGEALRIWAAGHLYKSREVTSSGPYRWFAHPLYVGSSIMGTGLALAANNAIVVLLVALYLVITLSAAVKSEEGFLRGAFAEEYDRYRRGTAKRTARRFSLAQARANREQRAILGLLLAMLLLFLKATYNGSL
jgi:protein-S-isoprenylcysteine O-methyltransferase Ste14